MIGEQKKVSRKAQELSITTLVLIVLGVVVLVLLILGFTRGWDWIASKFDILPGQSLETLAQSCNVAAGAGLAIDFCSYKKIKVDGVTQYANCEDARLIDSRDPAVTVPTCSGTYTALAYCQNQLKGNETAASCSSSRASRGIVNGQSCCVSS